jgi:hypothetical protein
MGDNNRPGGSGDPNVGTLQIPLDAISAAGVTYRLSNANFLITSATTSTVLSGDTPTVQTDLDPGSYQIQLLSGFTIDEIDPDGTTHPVQGTIVSPNPQSFAIRSQRTTTVTFAIKVGEIVVTTGPGTLSVTATIDDTLIDDFEDGDGVVALIAGRNGAWFTFNDTTGTQTPAPGTPIVPDLDAGGNSFLHSTGSGFALSQNGNFGAGIGADFHDGSAGVTPYNGSGYNGITFTYSLNSNAFFGDSLRFDLATSATTDVQFGGTCTTGCEDDFGISLQPTFGFPTTVSIPFSQLSQQGFGTPVTFDPSTLLNMKWIITFQTQPGDFDFTLDNISFTK